MIAIAEHSEGSVLPLRVQPGARKNGVKGEQAGALKLAVTAPPEDGKANAAVIELLAELLEVKRSQIELISGATSRSKKILIRGVTAGEIQQRVGLLLQ
jgi:uncharacterized protein (TIGR00251 family)